MTDQLQTERLRACVGPDRSTTIDVDDQVDLTLQLLRRARRFRDLTVHAGRADIRRDVTGQARQ